ncbi:L-2-hydroxyglutarate oxidase [Paracoccus sp. Z330]|uniref:L-2-hydroxyglutarate oxidase n=1 Tax=Paracoccus onchidii TaxID=3017813 RepID=A0ABT4ZGA8_9RHOB|nr:L-2-hydroxyglutarate oxidase [Paracoccus onchidii]MDB6178405.1 L-2-hydroxyglutarate oxidase [Paracoccus onchidii]
MKTYDYLIVGGGIVGLAAGRSLQQAHPRSRILLLEKEEAVARHQSGRNSGVIHAGVYYAPGSLKAQFCREGKQEMRRYCEEHGVRVEACGKLIVAVDEAETVRLQALEDRARANGIEIERLTRAEARQAEPNIKAEAALLSPSTCIVDFAEVARLMAREFEAAGGTIAFDHEVIGGSEQANGVTVLTTRDQFVAGKAIFCAGLQADRMAKTFGAEIDFRIVPFRGEYFRVNNQPDDFVRHLIYPVPDPARPFLGVHLTRKMDGGFTVGPNAVLAMAREGYGKMDIRLRDLADSMSYRGFWRLVAANAGSAMSELSASALKRLYLRRVQRYCDHIRLQDLSRYRPGIRAQAVRPDGTLVDDFLFARTRHTLHVCNAPSPAATSSLPIGRHIAQSLLN